MLAGCVDVEFKTGVDLHHPPGLACFFSADLRRSHAIANKPLALNLVGSPTLVNQS